MTRTKRRIFTIAAAAFIMVVGVGGAVAMVAAAAGPPVTAPSSGPGPYYSGPVHECLSGSNESAAYFELHSTALGNCAQGYRQVTVNELTPAFTLQINGGPVMSCTAATAQAETALACSTPSSSPSSSPSPG